MQFSTTILYSIVLTLAGNALAAPINSTATSEIEQSNESGVVGTSNGVEFPFSDDAILEAVALGDDIAPIVLKDSVFFVNTTKVEEEYSQLSKRDAEANPDAWYWRQWYNGQPMYKREASPDAEADAKPWYWRKWYNVQPMY